MNLGEKIKIIRNYYKLTQKEFAKILNVTHAHISKIETGKDFPSNSLLTIILDKFNINKDWIESEKVSEVEYMISDNMTFINNIIFLRNEQDKTKQEMSYLLNLSCKYSSLENHDLHDKLRLSSEDLYKICDYFNVSVYSIINTNLSNKDIVIENFDSLTGEEIYILDIYNSCSKSDKELIFQFIKKFEV